MTWEVVIGLETHAQLSTASKIFSGAATAFGAAPNTQASAVDIALPGVLPVLNKGAVERAIRFGLAVGATINTRSVFARKNYFYPDMPKAYQISQYDQPLNVDGYLDLPDGSRVGIERAHMEEDAGKSVHVGGSEGRVHGAEHTLIDLNRAGVPLVEIVSRPDISSPDQAREYVSELRAILLAIGASDAKMEEGSMRVDANVSVRKPGDPLGTRCEIKNVNSVRSVGRAIEYEARRQIDLIEAGEKVQQQTRHWSEADGRTHTLRTKEDADDYRYFLEPDLVPLDPSAEWIESVRAALPPLPATRRAALATAAGLAPDAEAIGLLVERGQDAYVLAVADAGGDLARAIVHVQQAFAEAGDSPAVPAADLARLTGLEVDGKLTATQAKTVVGVLLERDGGDAEAIAAELGYEAVDSDELAGLVDAAIAAEPDAWAKFQAGEGKAMGALVGHVMKASKGQADGKLVTALLNSRKG